MPRGGARRRLVKAEDSDTEPEPELEIQIPNIESLRMRTMQDLQMIDLGTSRAGEVKAIDRPQKMEDRANVRKLLQQRDMKMEGSDAHALYTKNMAAVDAWNDKNILVDPNEEDFDPLDYGSAHRQRVRNQYGGKIEEPTDFEAGYVTSRRVTRGRGDAFHNPGPIRRPGPHVTSTSRRSLSSAPVHNYRPLDPAVDPDGDPRSKYSRNASRGCSPGGRNRGGGNAGRGTNRGSPNTNRATAASCTPRKPVSNTNRIDILADPAAFMRAVSKMNESRDAAKTTSAPALATTKPFLGGSATKISSKWGDPLPQKPAAEIRTSPSTTLPSGPAAIRQVPANEFSLPPPHRGDSESWTDGIQSTRLSALDSPVPSTQVAPQPSPATAPTISTNVGLGIGGIDTTVETKTSLTIDLLDINEDLSALREPLVGHLPLARRIIVNGHAYILDESALGNAAATVTVHAPSGPPPEPITHQEEWTVGLESATTDAKSKKTSSPGGTQKVSKSNASQTTPSLAQSKWADPASASHFRPRVDNPFANNTAPNRTGPARISSPGDFAAFSRQQDAQAASASHITGFASPEEVKSVTSTPNFPVNLSASSGVFPNVHVARGASIKSTYSTTATEGAVDRDAAMGNTGSNTTSPPVIDTATFVSMQQVGNASFGMIPFRTPSPPPRPTPTRRESTVSCLTTDSNFSTFKLEGLGASRYATGNDMPVTSSRSDALQSLTGNTLHLYGVDNISKPPSSSAIFSAGLNVSRFANQQENHRPQHSPKTSSSNGTVAGNRTARVQPSMNRGRNQSSRQQKPQDLTKITRTSAGPGFAILQAELASAVGRDTTIKANKGTGLFSSNRSAATQQTNKPADQDDGYESEL